MQINAPTHRAPATPPKAQATPNESARSIQKQQEQQQQAQQVQAHQPTDHKPKPPVVNIQGQATGRVLNVQA